MSERPAIDLTILIPAAGASSRMRGADKLLAAINGLPLLRRTAQIALSAHPKVCITLGPQDQARRDALHGLTVTLINVPDANLGLSASLRRGAAAADPGGLLVLPADMPDLSSADLTKIINAATQAPFAIIRATGADGTPGHPVIFPSDLVSAFANLKGDEGARSILQAHKSRVRLFALPGQNALTDLDTPEAWAAWRLAQNDQS